VLTARSRGFLDRLQRAASAYPLSGNPDLRNDLCLDQTTRDGPFLTSFLTAGGVERFAGSKGSLLEDPQLWRCVSNDAFFAAIRLARDHYDAPHSSWARPSVSADAMRLDPDEHALGVFRLGVFLGFSVSTDLPLMQAHVLELYERARGLADLPAGIERERDCGWVVGPP
jgi:hypothetical protein